MTKKKEAGATLRQNDAAFKDQAVPMWLPAVTLTRLKEVRHFIHGGIPPWMESRTFPTIGQTLERLKYWFRAI